MDIPTSNHILCYNQVMNDVVEKIKRAVLARKPVEFEYVKEGKVQGKRIGNPHIIFAGKTKEGVPRIWSHIVQTGGVSDTLEDFPNWRMFIVDFIENVVILEGEASFDVSEGYNPESNMYMGTEILAKL